MTSGVTSGVTSGRTVTVATRKSALALAQSRAWMAELRDKTHVETKELLVVTTGDKIQDRPLQEVGGKGLFLKEIEEALLAGTIDLAKKAGIDNVRWVKDNGDGLATYEVDLAAKQQAKKPRQRVKSAQSH